MQKTETPQDEASGQNPRKSYQYAHLQAHAWNGKEKRQLGHPQTNLWKSDSASPDEREELTEEGDLPLERSKHVYRSHHQTTDCDARESGTRPDAAGHQTRQDQQREQQAKRQPQQASQSQHKKWPPQQQSKTGTRYPPTLLQKRSHPPRLQVLPGKRSQTSS